MTPAAAGAPMTELLRRVCSWCERDMGTRPSIKAGVTHGICPPCIAQWQRDKQRHRQGARVAP